MAWREFGHWQYGSKFKFRSSKQQNWYFQSLEDLDLFIKNWGKYSDTTLYWLQTHEFEGTDMEWVDNLIQKIMNFIPQTIGTLDNYLVSKGYRSIGEQMQEVDKWPTYIRWLAEPMTAVILSYVLAFAQLVSVAHFATMAEQEAFWATNGVAKMPSEVRAAFKEFYFNNLIKEEVYKQAMMKEIRGIKMGDMTKFFKIIEAYSTVLPNAEGMGQFYLSLIRKFPQYMPMR